MSKNKRNSNCKFKLIEENMEYVHIISKIEDRLYFINLYLKFINGNIDVLDWMDIMDEIVEISTITDEELNYLSEKLKYKLLEQNYTVSNILREVNIINDEKLSLCKKEEKLRRILSENNNSSYNYNYKNPKRTTPQDLKEYSDRRWVTKIITNPVGGKR